MMEESPIHITWAIIFALTINYIFKLLTTSIWRFLKRIWDALVALVALIHLQMAERTVS